MKITKLFHKNLLILQHESTMNALEDSINKMLKLSKRQTDTAIKVISNLNAETTMAVQNEKSHQIQQAAKSFGVHASQLGHLKGVLTPTLPYEFRNLDVKPEHVESALDNSKRVKMLSATEIIAESSESQKKTMWSSKRNCTYKSAGYRSPTGIFAAGHNNNRADANCGKPHAIGPFLRKLSAGTFFTANTNRVTLEGTYKALKNIRPAIGTMVANLMFLESAKCPSGMEKYEPAVCTKFADDLCITLLNHPNTKSALAAILKKMLMDLGRHNVTTKAVLSGKVILPMIKV